MCVLAGVYVCVCALEGVCVCVCVLAGVCERACVHACVRARACVCVCVKRGSAGGLWEIAVRYGKVWKVVRYGKWFPIMFIVYLLLLILPRPRRPRLHRFLPHSPPS